MKDPKHKPFAVIMIVVLAIVFIKALLPTPFKNREESDGFWLRKTHSEQRNNVVIGGDSRIYRGVSPESLAKHLHEKLSIINLGYSSAGFSDEYLDFLVSRIDTTTYPRILVLGITPYSLTVEATKNEALLQYQNKSGFEVFRGKYLSEYLESFAPYKPSNYFLKKTKPRYYEDFTKSGWVASHKMPFDSTQALWSYRKTFKIHKVNNAVIRGLLDKIEEIQKKRITIIAFRPPVTKKMKRLENKISGFRELEIKSELKERGVFWLNVNNSRYQSYDGSHLFYNSAEEFSGDLATFIDSVLKINAKYH